MCTSEKAAVLNPLSLRNTIGDEIADMMEARGITGFETLIGVKGLRGKEKLSDKALRRAAEALGDPGLANLLAGFQQSYLDEKPGCIDSYRRAKKAYAKLKSVRPLLRGEFTDGFDVLDDICDFFGVDSEAEVFEMSEKQAALFRSQNKIKVDPINLHAWLRRGELDFDALRLPDYDESKLAGWVESRKWRHHEEDVQYFMSLPSEFSRYGVGLVFVPSLPNTVYGAIRWMQGRPLIQISDRGRDLASCWFTLFHELGHAVKHKDVEIYDGEINESKGAQDRREREANKFANEYLFNGDGLRKAVFSRKRSGMSMNAIALAEEFNVPPIFASYWLIKAQYNPSFQRKIAIDFVSRYQ